MSRTKKGHERGIAQPHTEDAQEVAPFNEERLTSRAMRSAVFHAKKSDEFHQQAFDRAVAALVHSPRRRPG